LRRSRERARSAIQQNFPQRWAFHRGRHCRIHPATSGEGGAVVEDEGGPRWVPPAAGVLVPATRLLPSFLSKLSLATRSAIEGVTPSSAKATAPSSFPIPHAVLLAESGRLYQFFTSARCDAPSVTPAMKEGEDGRYPFEFYTRSPRPTSVLPLTLNCVP
jgi:hypothetical protein